MNVHFIKLNEKYFDKIDKSRKKDEIDDIVKISKMAEKEVMKDRMKKVVIPKNFIWSILAKGTNHATLSQYFKNLNWNDIPPYLRDAIVKGRAEQIDEYASEFDFKQRSSPRIENNINIFKETDFSMVRPDVVEAIIEWATNSIDAWNNKRNKEIQLNGENFPVNLEIWDESVQKFETYVELNIYTYVHNSIMPNEKLTNTLVSPPILLNLAYIFNDESFDNDNIFPPKLKNVYDKEHFIEYLHLVKIEVWIWYALFQYMKQHPNASYNELGKKLDGAFMQFINDSSASNTWDSTSAVTRRRRQHIDQFLFGWLTPENMLDLFFFKPEVEEQLNNTVQAISKLAASTLNVPVKTNLIINPAQGFTWPEATSNWEGAHEDVLKTISSDVIQPENLIPSFHI